MMFQIHSYQVASSYFMWFPNEYPHLGVGEIHSCFRNVWKNDEIP